MAVTLYTNFDDEDFDGTIRFTAGADTTGTLFNSATLSTSSPLVGATSLNIPGSGNSLRYNSETAVISRLVGSIAFAFTFSTFGNNAGLFSIFGADANNAIEVQFAGTDELRFRISTATGPTSVSLLTTAANLATSTLYYCVVRWDQPANSRSISVYNSAGALIETVSDTSTAYTAPTELVRSDGIRLGEATGNNAVFKLDNFFIADAYAEPLENNLDIDTFADYDSSDPEEITGTGAATIAAATASGTGVRGLQDTGGAVALLAPLPIVAGEGTVTPSGPQEVTGTGALTIEGPTVSGTAIRRVSGSGALVIAPVEVDGTGTGPNEKIGSGALSINGALVSGSGHRGITGTGALVIRRPAIGATALLNGEGTGGGEAGAHRPAQFRSVRRSVRSAHGEKS
jgi:hypothetical protein